jgi:mannobiose 2-epimerase
MVGVLPRSQTSRWFGAEPTSRLLRGCTTRALSLARQGWKRIGAPSIRLPSAPPDPAGPDPSGLAGAIPILDRILVDNVMPFWLREAPDPHAGGFRLNHDVAGRWRGAAPKGLVSQARTLWFFARLMRRAEPEPAVASLAAQGLKFLAERMWDPRYGGFYWEVDATGSCASRSDKHAYGQAQALYALSELALAGGNGNAHGLARATFDLLEQHFHDREHGGYREFLRADLTSPPPGRPGYLGAPPECKLMNTHLHLLEAMTAYCRLSADDLPRARLAELAEIIGVTVVHKHHGTSRDRHDADWAPWPGGRGDRASYGHDFEIIHLLTAADETLGRAPDRRLDLYVRLFEHGHRCGEDANGGFWAGGPPDRPADDRRKVWWVQAEVMLGALELYRLTGETVCAELFLRTLEWVRRWQVDWQAGEWHAEIAGGRAYGLKAGPWKGPYHNGRVLIRSLDLLGEYL